MKIASFVVGINTYCDQYYNSDELSLKYAESDASTFHEYARMAWSDSPSENHILLVGTEATLGNIKAHFAKLGERGGYDLFLVFLSGHGDRENISPAWFCAADSLRRVPSLTTEMLDMLLSSVAAQVTLLFLDCCYSESVLQNSKFFTSLAGANARLFICSSRVTQRTWEDDKLKHGVFTAVLLSKLTGKLSVSQQIDVEQELFPCLSATVPRTVFAQKRGSFQEPVKGGISVTTVKLPLVPGVNRIYPTTLQVLQRRVGQILTGLVITAVLIIICAHIFLYHFALENGQIIVKTGLKSISGFVPSNIGVRVRTGISANTLAMAPNNVKRLEDESIWGIWTQKGPHGRRWIDQLLAMREGNAIRNIQVLLDDQYVPMLPEPNPASLIADSPIDSFRPFQQYVWAANSLVMNRSRANETARWLIETAPRWGSFDCEHSVRPVGFMNSEVAEHLFALAQAASTLPFPFTPVFPDALSVASYGTQSSGWNNSDAVVNEHLQLARLYKAIKDSASRDSSISQASALRELVGTWCGISLANVLAEDEEWTEQSRLILLDAVLQNQNATSLAVGLDGLARMAANGKLRSEDVATVYEHVVKIDPQKSGENLVSYGVAGWLRRVVQFEPIPPDLRKSLFDNLCKPRSGSNLELNSVLANMAMELLAKNLEFLSEAEKNDLVAKVRTAPVPSEDRDASKTCGEPLEAWGWLGKTDAHASEAISSLRNYLDPNPLTREKLDKTGRRISVNQPQYVIALARIAQAQSLSYDDKLELLSLAKFAFRTESMDRDAGEILTDFPESPDALVLARGVAAQFPLPADAQEAALQIRDKLAEASTDSLLRELESAVASQQLRVTSCAIRPRIQEYLYEMWKSDDEPEVRLALAACLIELQRETFNKC